MNALFVLAALVTAFGAVLVVAGKNLVRCVMALALALLGAAVVYALLGATFLAGVQVLTYVGGVVTLMIFGVMVTRRHDGSVIAAGSVQSLRGVVAALAFFGVLATAVLKTDLPRTEAPPAPTTLDLASALLKDHLLAFETASVLLLAAIVGAIVLVRRRDAAHPAEEVAKS